SRSYSNASVTRRSASLSPTTSNVLTSAGGGVPSGASRSSCPTVSLANRLERKWMRRLTRTLAYPKYPTPAETRTTVQPEGGPARLRTPPRPLPRRIYGCSSAPRSRRGWSDREALRVKRLLDGDRRYRDQAPDREAVVRLHAPFNLDHPGRHGRLAG